MISGYDYHVGDRVRALGCNWFNVQAEDTGTVIAILDDFNVGVQWDENIDGHSCSGRGKRGRCSWEMPSTIKIIQTEQETIDEQTLVLEPDCDLI